VVAAAASAYLVQGTGEWTDGVGQPCGPDTTPTQRWSDVQSRTSMRGATWVSIRRSRPMATAGLSWTRCVNGPPRWWRGWGRVPPGCSSWWRLC